MIAQHSIPYMKNETQNRLFMHEFILQKGSTVNELYQVISGSAYLIDESGQILYSFSPKAYLNLNEQRYKLHNIKTIKAGALCDIAIFHPSSGELKQMHDCMMPKVLRKCQIPLFTSLPNWKFEEIMQYFTKKVLVNLQELPYEPDQFYIVAEGNYEFTSCNSKLLTLSKGETFTRTPEIIVKAKSSVNALISVPLCILKEILPHYFDNIQAFNRKQLEVIERYARYTSLNLIKFPISQSEDVPKAFRNQIQSKIQGMERRQKVRSVTLRKDGSRMSLKEQISHMKKENRKNSVTYGKEYFTNKKLEVFKNQKSVSCQDLLFLARKERMSSPVTISYRNTSRLLENKIESSQKKIITFKRDSKPRMTCCQITRIHDIPKQIKRVNKFNHRDIAKFKIFRN